MEVPMAAATISATEEFCRGQFARAIDEHRPTGPTVRTILDTLLTETASHVGADELRPYGDANRFVVKLVLTTLTERYYGLGAHENGPSCAQFNGPTDCACMSRG
jgi:hypothetical protein